MPEVLINGFGGINNTSPVEHIESGWARRDKPLEPAKIARLESAINVDITDTNGLIMRTGEVMRVSGAATSLWSDNDNAFVVQSGNIYRIKTDFSKVIAVSGVHEDVVFERVDDSVYWMDANGLSGVISPSGARSWGLPVPPAPTTLTLIDGFCGAGKYLVVLTYLRNDGQESGAGMASAISTTSDTDGIQVTWDQPTDTDISHVTMYVSTRDGEILYKAVTVPVADGVASFTGGDQSHPLTTQWLEAPPVGHLITLHRGRLLIAVDEFIMPTTAMGYELYDPRDFLAVDGSKITMLKSLDSVLFVGTEQGVVVLRGDDLKAMSQERPHVSGVLPGSAVVTDRQEALGDPKFSGQSVVMFVSDNSIQVGLPDGTIQNLTENEYNMTTGVEAAALFRVFRGTHQYLVIQRS
jgi:hypothetical protein